MHSLTIQFIYVLKFNFDDFKLQIKEATQKYSQVIEHYLLLVGFDP